MPCGWQKIDRSGDKSQRREATAERRKEWESVLLVVIPLNFSNIFTLLKTRSLKMRVLGLLCHENPVCHPRFSCFNTIPAACDGHMDRHRHRQTDTHDAPHTKLCGASCGQKLKTTVHISTSCVNLKTCTSNLITIISTWRRMTAPDHQNSYRVMSIPLIRRLQQPSSSLQNLLHFSVHQYTHFSLQLSQVHTMFNTMLQHVNPLHTEGSKHAYSE